MRDREAREPGLRFSAAAGRTLVADLSARAGRGAGIRRDRGRMVVRLDLHHEVRGLVDVGVDPSLGVRTEPTARLGRDHGRVVLVSGQHATRRVLVGVADHREQALRRGCAIDQPVRVEHLVAAVLGVRLREHHELDVARIARHGGELRGQVLDLVRRECEPETRRSRARALGGRRAARRRRVSASARAPQRAALRAARL